MLRLYDTRTRRVEEVRPAAPGRLLVCTPEPAPGREPPAGDLRAALLSDLIRRVAEEGHGLRVIPVHSGPEGDGDGSDRELAALNIHPVGHPRTGACSEQVADLGIEPSPPHQGRERAQPGGTSGSAREKARLWVRAEPTLVEGHTAGPSPCTGYVIVLGELAERGLDPLALRLALLAHRYRERVNLTWDELHAADTALARWRTRVAEWAESPSAPMKADHVDPVREAFDDDLDTPAATRIARELELDGGIPAGSKFEASAYLDRLLGLDLARDVGKPH